MSLKVNVIYKGIIYRVKGIKVLCSVVMAVIILLVAIVAMGVWMLVNVYDDKSVFGSPSNSSSANIHNKSAPSVAPSIDFAKSRETVSSDILLHSIVDKNQKEIDQDIKGEPKNTLDSNPDVYESPFYDSTHRDKSIEEEQMFSESDTVQIEGMFVPLREQSNSGWNGIDKKMGSPHLTLNTKNSKEFSEMPYVESKTHDPEFIPLSPVLRESQDQNSHEPNFDKKEFKGTMDIPFQLRQPGRETNSMKTPFLQRKGLVARDQLDYTGPPVVGYGSNPYEKLTQERIREYDHFWKSYVGNKIKDKTRLPSSESVIRFKSEDAIRGGLRPHLRGLRPRGGQYDLHVRPDAQTPSKVHPQTPPDQKNPNRKLQVKNVPSQLPPSPPSRIPSRPGIPLLGPLQDLYDYSKKLAASLLSFNSKSEDQIRNSSEKLAEYGINLIETHNHIFGSTTGTPFDRIVALVPTAERLRSLDPFELSLVTWTFLDFWEFLIEKVGTLSDEDLNLLQERLESLRRRKDDTMTRVLVNETLTRYHPNIPRSISNQESYGSIKNQAITNETQEKEDKDPLHKENDVSTTPEPVAQDKILGNLFPSISEGNAQAESTANQTPTKPLLGIKEVSLEEEQRIMNQTLSRIMSLLQARNDAQLPPRENTNKTDEASGLTVEGRAAWNPLGLFTSEARMQFMQFAVKVLFNFGKVYLKKPYALDCSMLLFCKDLNQDTKRGGMDAMAAKLKSVGLKVLTESDQELRESDTFGEIWRSVTSWSPLQCDTMFPRCDGPKALEIVNEVALGEN